jgi:hypothetical protein
MTKGHHCKILALAWLAFGAALPATPASSQQPTQEQISAVRSSCRSDYMAKCSSVQPGGIDALHCLERNSAQLSGACRKAVSAIAGPAPAAAPTPAAATPAAAPATAAPAQPRAATSTARTTPPPTHPAPPPAQASAPPPPPAPSAAAMPPPPAANLPPPGAPMPQLTPFMEMVIFRSCGNERQTVCNLPPGGGRIIACLVANEGSVSPRCAGALTYARTN